jgi:hypothetical protein
MYAEEKIFSQVFKEKRPVSSKENALFEDFMENQLLLIQRKLPRRRLSLICARFLANFFPLLKKTKRKP